MPKTLKTALPVFFDEIFQQTWIQQEIVNINHLEQIKFHTREQLNFIPIKCILYLINPENQPGI